MVPIFNASGELSGIWRTILFALIILGAGVLVPVQTALNSGLGRRLDSSLAATFVVFLISTLFLLLLCLIFRPPFHQLNQLAEMPWFNWVGGLLGALYILSLIFAAPEVGIGLSTTLVVLGQVTAGVVVDHYGLFGMPQQSFSAGRFGGIMLIVAGATLLKFF